MSNITTCLFDFDGVIVNTEPIYDHFWGEIGERFQLGIPDFAARIKGTTLRYILDTYFSHFSQEEQDKVVDIAMQFEQVVDLPLVPGVMEYMYELKEKGYRVGLVTSSTLAKMETALKRLNLDTFFDTVVTAARITRGKPDPMCYLLAAEDLKARPEECVVFEDSFSGIQSGINAGMRVIGLSTTNPAEAIQDKVYAVIPDFRNGYKI